jgi:hypothetical protein
MTTPAQSVRSGGRRVGLLALGVSLLTIGVALSYLTLTRRWGYYSGIPLDPSQLIPEDRASMTVWWWDQTNFFCGPFPAIWPAIVVLCAAPLIVGAMRGRATSPLWGRLGLLGAVFGAITVLVAAWTFVEFSYFHDSGWVYAADASTLALALSGYTLLFLAILALRRASRISAQPTQSRD